MKILRLTPADNLEKIINGLKEPAKIVLAAGIYRQKVLISANDIEIAGEDREACVISHDDFARKIHADGQEYNTFRTYTVCVTGERVKFENFTIENSNADPASVGQCVALSVNAKAFSAKNMDLKSTQDTLFCAPFPDDLVVRYRGFIPEKQLYMEGGSEHLFQNCRIYGTVDFIFGCADAYFMDCELISVADSRNTGFVCAPAHSLKQERGFIFLNCKFVDGGAGAGTVYLARPWRDFGKCTFVNCVLGNHVVPDLFDKWNDTERDKTARFGYYNLACGFTPAPAPWSAQLTETEVLPIIKLFKAKFKA